jgi:hypothetical protein
MLIWKGKTMLKEPSVLLIDDEEEHYNSLCKMELDKESDAWKVEGVITVDIDEALEKASKIIVDNEGFTVILLDIRWFYDKDDYESYAGLKILKRLYKTCPVSPICRKVMIVTKAASVSAPDPILQELQAKNPSIVQIPFQFETQYGRDGIKKCLLDYWQQIKSESITKKGY